MNMGPYPLQALAPKRLGWPIHDNNTAKHLEQTALAALPPYTLLPRAGLSVARWVRAMAPHARHVLIAVGPGHNGGDGLVAAARLAECGIAVEVVLCTGQAPMLPEPARALQEAQLAGVRLHGTWPESTSTVEVVVDAVLGLGQSRSPEGAFRHAIEKINQFGPQRPVLAIDIPTGLCSDTGVALGGVAVNAAATLSLLSLKPGLFTGQGRDHCGDIWFDDLEVSEWLPELPGAAIRLSTASSSLAQLTARRHGQHKGSFGDVWVVGGDRGMQGAAWLAGRAALTAGAGRVMIAAPAGSTDSLSGTWPELMPRSTAEVLQPNTLRLATLVCGCGGGKAMAPVLPDILRHAQTLVLDADALNAIAEHPPLWRAMAHRGKTSARTWLTPHPLEAARLLGCTVQEVQADRIAAARELARRSGAVVVLKGSGTVLACANGATVINSSGNARLASPGTGDVLAGWLGGQLSAAGPEAQPLDLAAAVVWLHGAAAEEPPHGAPPRGPLLASQLIGAMAGVRDKL